MLRVPAPLVIAPLEIVQAYVAAVPASATEALWVACEHAVVAVETVGVTPRPSGTLATVRLASQPLDVSTAPSDSLIRLEFGSGAISTDGVPCPLTIVPPAAVQFRFENSDALVTVARRLPESQRAFVDR